MGMEFKELGYNNITEFLAYTLCGRYDRTRLHQSRFLHRMSQQFLDAVGLQLTKDNHAAATFMNPSDEPLMASYRPLLFYTIMEAVAGYGHLTLTLRMGFSKLAMSRHATYYVKHGRDPRSHPIVFLHGIGLGLAPYTGFLNCLSKLTGRTVIAVQYKHVSMRLTSHIPSATDIADDVARMLKQQGFEKAAVMGHSYGTLVASSFTRRHRLLLDGLTLIDPVCFAMFLPHLVRNTLYFHTTQEYAGPFTWKKLMKGIVVRDLHCAAAMSRRFHWGELNLWPSEVPPNTTVVLSGQDQMIPVSEIRELLAIPTVRSKQVNVICHPRHGHGGFLLDSAMQLDIIRSSFAPGTDGLQTSLQSAIMHQAAHEMLEPSMAAWEGNQPRKSNVVPHVPPRKLQRMVQLQPVVRIGLRPVMRMGRPILYAHRAVGFAVAALTSRIYFGRFK